MKITSAAFVKSAMLPNQYPRDGRLEFAFVGRSNVGKSSLMNVLLARKGLAKTSQRPGKTQTLNFFDINEEFYFVDLPGYGFAKVPVSIKEQWGKVMTAYLRNRPELRLVVQLLDARRIPTDKDLDMLALLDQASVPTLVVATKVDKLRPAERKTNLQRIRTALDLDEEALVLPFSAVTGEGRREVWEIIEDILANPSGGGT